ncbi:MAG TPA: D-alanyl-D-alanine carboxypeptidase family protein [Sedimentibacter sp.]|nr:D-alanyl-D-alanine carboxypeptidase family protein [Sedimentibacter sp.]HPV85805.1 D-alanyl-D-alanine carboxypeptidase family protein [Sedimentibacter sp.]HQK53877.1 D-alanyl-D-alanine carboxypeptidase family protein [Sedimentibacter sp.]HQO71924.1 D-alanyl-D-alanine carboxypeptidase family protein [Sedimentibacter sp.]HQO94730.1 D-alanyl-D-alanine carboxypeptidase family protein [Sedimentibacter sp.]
MKKRIAFYILVFMCLLVNFNIVYATPAILSESAVLIDASSGTILAQKNADKKMYPASLTKIMTAILAIELGELTDVITVDDDTPFEIEGSHIALEPGEILTLKDLLYALMLPSANDAASVIAKHYGGSLENFVKMMNQKAKELGAYNTNFTNPHGLHDTNHYSTAADLALITKYTMENDTFRKIVSTTKYEIQTTNKKDEPRYFTTLNKLIYNTSYNQIYVDGAYISPYYEYATGAKTGYTPQAGNCLVATAKKDGTELIAVTMKGISLEMYQDAHNLFNYGFEEYESATLVGKNTFIKNIKIPSGDSKEISLITESDLTALIKKDTLDDIKSNVYIDDITLPIEKNSVIGKIEYTLDNKVIGAVNLISPISVKSTAQEGQGNIFLTIVKFIGFLILFAAVSILLLKIYNDIRIRINRKKRRSRYNNY